MKKLNRKSKLPLEWFFTREQVEDHIITYYMGKSAVATGDMVTLDNNKYIIKDLSFKIDWTMPSHYGWFASDLYGKKTLNVTSKNDIKVADPENV